MTTILHTYTDVRPQDQTQTKVLVNVAANYYKIKSEKMIAPDDYWSFLLRNWGKDDLIIIEQDVVPKLHQIELLNICKERVCTHPYTLAAGQLSVFDVLEDAKTPFHTVELGYYSDIDTTPPFTEGSSLGFVKIDRATQQHIPLWEYPVQTYEWWYLDSFISYHLKRLNQKVHIHKPEVKHNRTVEVTFQIGNETIVVS